MVLKNFRIWLLAGLALTARRNQNTDRLRRILTRIDGLDTPETPATAYAILAWLTVLHRHMYADKRRPVNSPMPAFSWGDPDHQHHDPSKDPNAPAATWWAAQLMYAFVDGDEKRFGVLFNARVDSCDLAVYVDAMLDLCSTTMACRPYGYALPEQS